MAHCQLVPNACQSLDEPRQNRGIIPSTHQVTRRVQHQARPHREARKAACHACGDLPGVAGGYALKAESLRVEVSVGLQPGGGDCEVEACRRLPASWPRQLRVIVPADGRGNSTQKKYWGWGVGGGTVVARKKSSVKWRVLLLSRLVVSTRRVERGEGGVQGSIVGRVVDVGPEVLQHLRLVQERQRVVGAVQAQRALL